MVSNRGDQQAAAYNKELQCVACYREKSKSRNFQFSPSLSLYSRITEVADNLHTEEIRDFKLQLCLIP